MPVSRLFIAMTPSSKIYWSLRFSSPTICLHTYWLLGVLYKARPLVSPEDEHFMRRSKRRKSTIRVLPNFASPSVRF
jgi:hypothetical protein